MHRIIKSYLDSFVTSFGLQQEPEFTQFEMFSNYVVVSSKVSSQFELDNITTGNGDDGIDGVAIVINEEILISQEDAESMFSTSKRNHDVEAVFIQAKTSEEFDLGDFLKFKESIIRFVSSENYEVTDETQKNSKEVFDVCISNVTKIRGGRPSLTARYIATGIYRKPQALEQAKTDFELQLKEIGYFNAVDIKFIGRDELAALWISTYSGISAQLDMFSQAALPNIEGVEEAYLAVVKAKDFVNKLLLAEDGSLKSTQVFEENIRAFLGLENPVNKSISETLSSGKGSTRFPVLNNGITIVSPNVIAQGTTLHLENYQIINGCQTSCVLFENRDLLDDSIMVNLKVIETSNEDVFSELVRATNSQTKVDETQFLSLQPIVKKIEQYFNTFEGNDGRLHFERREKQYVGREIPALRIFSVNLAAKCVAAMFFQRPDLSSRYPKRMYELLAKDIFNEANKEIIFYAACLTLYRLHLLVSSSVIPQNMKRYKWHLLVLVRVIVSGKNIPKLNSKKIEPYCQKIVDAFSKYGDSVINPFQKAVKVIESMDHISADSLKKQQVLEDMLNKL
jgi:hypothetical protein